MSTLTINQQYIDTYQNLIVGAANDQSLSPRLANAVNRYFESHPEGIETFLEIDLNEREVTPENYVRIDAQARLFANMLNDQGITNALAESVPIYQESSLASFEAVNPPRVVDQPPVKNTFFIEGEEHSMLNVFETEGDGSCGLHALCGVYDLGSGKIRHPNIAQLRQDYANEIANRFNDRNLPVGIQEELKQWVLYNEVPNDVLVALENDMLFEGQYSVKFLEFSSRASDIDRIVDDNERQRAVENLMDEVYSSDEMLALLHGHLSEVTGYLSPNELSAAAEWQNKTIELHILQSEGKVSRAEIINEGACEPVIITYSNEHYELSERV